MENKNNNITENENNNNSKTKKEQVFKALDITTNIIIWIMLLITIIIFAVTVLSKNNSVFGYKMYVIKSGSMEPTICTNDVIVIKNDENLQKDDIIAFEQSKTIIVHRIVGISEENGEKVYQTKGDNNDAADQEQIKKSQIQGKLIFTMPFLGKTIVFIQSHLIVPIIIIGLALMLILIKTIIKSK